MRSDPRCPHCDGKVSATATWCMHCGADFDAPTERGGVDAAVTDALQTGSADDLGRALGDSESIPKVVGVAVAVLALVSFSAIVPQVNALFVFLAAGAVGYYVSRAETLVAAVEAAVQGLVAAPFLLLIVAILLGWPPSPGALVSPLVFAALVVAAGRRVRDRLAG